jgi:hypothetical protein
LVGSVCSKWDSELPDPDLVSSFIVINGVTYTGKIKMLFLVVVLLALNKLPLLSILKNTDPKPYVTM